MVDVICVGRVKEQSGTAHVVSHRGCTREIGSELWHASTSANLVHIWLFHVGRSCVVPKDAHMLVLQRKVRRAQVQVQRHGEDQEADAHVFVIPITARRWMWSTEPPRTTSKPKRKLAVENLPCQVAGKQVEHPISVRVGPTMRMLRAVRYAPIGRRPCASD